MICIAVLRQHRVSLQTFLRDSRSYPLLINFNLLSSSSRLPVKSTPVLSSKISKTTPVPVPSKIKTKKKDVILLYANKRNKVPVYLVFFVGFPMAVSFFIPWYHSHVVEVVPSGGWFIFSMIFPMVACSVIYTGVIFWGLRFPRKMELNSDMKLHMYVIRWPGYTKCVTLDPRFMRVDKENKDIYSIARDDLCVNYTLSKKLGTIERMDIVTKLFGKYIEAKKDRKK